MHELAVTESILDIALNHAQMNGAKKVTDIYLVIGKLSSIVDDSVQFYWDFISKDSICQAAKLHFERIPAEFTCLDCGNTYQIDKELSPCPNCGSAKVQIHRGNEFWVDSIEIQV